VKENEMSARTITEQRRDIYELGATIAPTWEARRAYIEDVSAPVRELLLRLGPRPGETVLELAAGLGDTGFEAATRLGERAIRLAARPSERLPRAGEKRPFGGDERCRTRQRFRSLAGAPLPPGAWRSPQQSLANPGGADRRRAAVAHRRGGI
jgi:hypothetical protein